MNVWRFAFRGVFEGARRRLLTFWRMTTPEHDAGKLSSLDAGLHPGSKSKEPGSHLRIGLLTPYGGTNLGDGAIQTAVIEGIRRQLPGVELWGITLNPAETARRHGIRAFPITGLLMPFYSETLFDPIRGLSVRFQTKSGLGENADNGEAVWSCSRDYGRLRQHLKKVPALGRTLKFLVNPLRKGFAVVHEIRHLGTSFHFVRTLDMVMVSGGGQLDESWGRAWGHPYALFRWAVLARLAGKQFVIVSVGVDEVRTKLCRYFTRIALSLASYRSYRDLVSKKLLEQWTFTKNDAYVPDLAFGLCVPEGTLPLLENGHPVIVGISPMAYGRYGSWPKPAPAVYSEYLSCLAKFVAFLAGNGCRVILFTTSGTDRAAIEDLQAMIIERWPVGIMDKVSAPINETVEELLQEVRKVDFVVASRLHGVILSHILGKPVLAISYDRKVGTHMQDVGQGRYLLELSNINSTELTACFQSLVGNAQESRKEVRKHILCFRKSIEKQYEHLAQILRVARST